jgi:hypothetical protein
MLITLGDELMYEFEQATHMVLNMNVHYTRSQDLQHGVAVAFGAAESRGPQRI